MTQKQAIQLFEQRKVRTVWDDEAQKWYCSIIDVVAVLTDNPDAAAYWRKLKQRLKAEGNETVTNCHSLKMLAADGKMRMTDVADAEQLFRLVQSIPSPKAEPFKLWLASLGRERLEEMDDPGSRHRPHVGILPPQGLFGELDQPVVEVHRGAQGANRRMGAPRREKGTGVRDPDRHHHAGLVGHDDAAV